MRSVVIQFVVFKDIHAAVRMVEQVVRVAAHNHCPAMVWEWEAMIRVEAISPSQSSSILT